MLYALVAGVLFGLYFSLIGLGLNLTFGVLRMVNLAHGDFLMIGGFAAVVGFSALHLHPLVSMIVVALLIFVVGLGLYYVLIPRIAATRDPEMISLVLFFGLSQAIEALAVIVFGNNERSIYQSVFGTKPVAVLGVSFPAVWVVSALVSLLALLGVYLYLYRTRLGYATRAVIASRDESLVSGINVHRVSSIAFAIGLGLAAVAGALSPFMLGGVTPDMGVDITVTAFAVIVLGSLGNPIGTVAGGLIYGIALMLMQTYLSSWSNILPYLLLLAVLLLKPSGLFGREVRNA
jgi:branched-chain amino acid transport system permease protein